MQSIGLKRQRIPSPKRVRFLLPQPKSFPGFYYSSQNEANIQELIDNIIVSRKNKNLLLIEDLLMKLSDILLKQINKIGLYAIIDTLLSDFVASHHLVLKIIDVAFYYGELDQEFYFPSFGIFEALLRDNKKNYVSLLFIRSKELFSLLPEFQKKCSLLSTCIDYIYAKFILWLPKNFDVRGFNQIILDFANTVSPIVIEQYSYFSCTLDAIKYLFDLPGSNRYRLYFLKKLTESFFKMDKLYLQRIASLLDFLALADEKIVLQYMLNHYMVVIKEKRYCPCLEEFEYSGKKSGDTMKKLLAFHNREYDFLHFINSLI